MNWFWLFTLSVVSFQAYSQNEKIIVKLCPLAFVDDATFPTLQGGVEFKLSDRITWYNELGVKYRKSAYEGADTAYVSSSGFKAKTEWRYYLPKFFRIGDIVTPMQGFYTGLNLFFVRDFHNSEIEYNPNDDGAVRVIDNFGVEKNIYGLNLIFGFQHTIMKHFVVDGYGGIGIRSRTVVNIHRQYNPDTDTLVEPVDITLSGIRDGVDLDVGHTTLSNLTLGLRLGYKF